MGRVIHFEIHAENPERAIRFYSTIFGWTFHKWEGPMDYWLIKTGEDGQPGINGGMVRRQGLAPTEGQPVNAYVCTIASRSVDEDLRKVTTAGGTIALAKMPIPGIGWLAYVKDPEGNIIGLMQNDPGAK
jgi:predicted enzyme related to lactoylglutathione lyase